MSKILKGDRLAVITSRAGLTAGKVYTARADESYREVMVTDDTYSAVLRQVSRFVKVDDTVKPKVGDRVVVKVGHGSAIFNAGDVLDVTAVTGDYYMTVKVSGSTRWFDADRFLVIAKPQAPVFKVGDRVQVSPDASHGTKGAIGIVKSYTALVQTAHHVTPPRKSQGYYTIEGDDARIYSAWDFDLTAYAPTFKAGDRVERTGAKHFIRGYSGFDYATAESKHGDAGEVLGKAWGGNDELRVRWDRTSRTSVISAQCLKAEPVKPTPVAPAPLAQPKPTTYKAGDRVSFKAGDYMTPILGTVIDPTESGEGGGVFGRRVAHVRLDGGQQGYRKDLSLAVLTKVEPPKPVEFKTGDKVITTIVAGYSEREGKPATVVRRGFKDRYVVEFADGKRLYAEVKAYDAKAVKFRDLEAAQQDAIRKAGKIAKLQSLAKELGYDVYPIAS